MLLIEEEGLLSLISTQKTVKILENTYLLSIRFCIAEKFTAFQQMYLTLLGEMPVAFAMEGMLAKVGLFLLGLSSRNLRRMQTAYTDIATFFIPEYFVF